MKPQPKAIADGAMVARVGGTGGTALSQQVLDAMIRAIRTGAFESGRLPPEVELAELLGVSRTTVRGALQSLEQIGLIVRRPGRGTRVRRHASADLLALHGLVPFPTLLRELGHIVSTEVSWRKLASGAGDLNLRLSRRVDGGGYERSVVLHADGSPAVSMLERFPVHVLGPEFTERDLSAGSILFVSEQCFKEKIDHAIVALEPHSTGEALGLPEGTPILGLDETFYSAEGRALATSHVWLNPRFVSFAVFRRFL